MMKQTNQHLVLQLIQGRGPISRKELIEITGLSSASVSGITGELIERGLVHEVGEADNDGRAGRKAVLLRLNPHAGYVVGVKLGMRTVACVLTDLDATVLHASETALPLPDQAGQRAVPFTPDTIIQATIQAVEHVLARAQFDRTRLLGIGVGINGIVDPDTGVSRLAPNFGWRNVPVAAPLAKHFGISVHLENDARTLTDEAVRGGRWYFDAMEAALRANAFGGLADSLRLIVEPGGNEIWARGAACVVLSALFTRPVPQYDTAPARSVRALMLA